MSAFSKFHPISLLAFFLSVLAITAFVQNPVISCLALFGGTLTFAFKGSHALKENIRLFAPIFCLVLLTNPLFSQNGSTILFYIGTLKVTAESVAYGAQLGMMLISVMLWCKVYNDVMTEDKLIYIFGKAFPQLSLVISTTLRYIPMLKRQSEKIIRSRKAMGLYSNENPVQKLRSSLSVFSSLISRSLEQAIETSRSMKARGYGSKSRSHYHDFSFKVHDAVLLFVCLICVTSVSFASVTGDIKFEFYPTTSQLTFSHISFIAYLSYTIMTVFPFFAEVFDEIRWKYHRRKI